MTKGATLLLSLSLWSQQASPPCFSLPDLLPHLLPFEGQHSPPIRYAAETVSHPSPIAAFTHAPPSEYTLWDSHTRLVREYDVCLAGWVYLWYDRLGQEWELGEAAAPCGPWPIPPANSMMLGEGSSKRRKSEWGRHSRADLPNFTIGYYLWLPAAYPSRAQHCWPMSMHSCPAPQQLRSRAT